MGNTISRICALKHAMICFYIIMTPKLILFTGLFFPCQHSQTIYIIDMRVLVIHENVCGI